MFSEREKKVIDIIGRRKLTFEEISSELFKKTDAKPLDSEISIANTVRRIIKKCSYYDLKWVLTKTRDNRKLIVAKETVKH